MKQAAGLLASAVAAAVSVGWIGWHDFEQRSIAVSFKSWRESAHCGVGLSDGSRVGFAVPAKHAIAKRIAVPAGAAATEIWCETPSGIARGKAVLLPGEDQADFGFVAPDQMLLRYSFDVISGVEPLH